MTGAPAPMVPDDASTVFLNVTAVNTAADGFVTVYPCGIAAADAHRTSTRSPES